VAFEIGDKVIYPNHGLGVIERIETKTIMGTTCGFYQLRMANETTVFVPVDNVDGVGLRRAINDDEVDRLFTLLGDGNIDSHQNWKGRFKDNSDRMRTGSIYDVVEVLKSLTFLAKSKSLSFREKRMLDRAKFLVVSEITEVLAIKTPDVEVRVEVALEECFATKARNAGKPKPKVVAPEPVAAVAPAPVVAPQPVKVAAPVAARVAPAPVKPAAPAAVKVAAAPVKAAAKVAVTSKVAGKVASKVKTPVKRAVKSAAPARVKATTARGKAAAAPRRAARAS
jgi:CarD family transcriptional regulator